MAIKHGEEIFESAYWAGRMIAMPDSRIAWDIANEIAEALNALKSQLKQRGEELKKKVEGLDQVQIDYYENKLEQMHRNADEYFNEIKELKEALREILPHAYCVHNDILDKAKKLL